MSSLQRIVITSQGTTADFKSNCDLSMGGQDALNNLAKYLEGVVSGTIQGASLEIDVGAVQASGTFTVATGGSANGQAGSLLNVALEAVTSGAVPADGEFNISATAATQAASMVIAINTVLAGKVLASSVGGVVTVTALVPGVVGNGLQISAGNLANVTAGAFASGADGTSYTLDFD